MIGHGDYYTLNIRLHISHIIRYAAAEILLIEQKQEDPPDLSTCFWDVNPTMKITFAVKIIPLNLYIYDQNDIIIRINPNNNIPAKP